MRGLMADLPRKETAEEQLLRLIEGAHAPQPQPATGPSGGTAAKPPWRDRLRHGWSQVSGAVALRVNALFRARQRGGDTVLRQLQLAGRLMWLVLVGLGLYVVASVVFSQSHPPRMASGAGLPSAGKGTVTPPPSPDTLVKPMAEYLSAVLQRNPFTGTSGSNSAAPVQRPRERLKELVGSLVVVGIDRGATPEALIEDNSGGRTYFVKVGDVVNGAFVKEITSRGVIVEYEGEEELIQ